MKELSRTNKSVKNSAVALIFYLFQLLLKFISQKVFIDTLGTEILGLNSTVQNLLSFLNLAELGIGSAVAFTLYKPIFNKEWKKIVEIISVQGWLYSRIAVIIIMASFVLMFFFPLIFAKIQIPLWYTYVSYIVFLYSTLLGYFVNYKQVILSASQEDYKIKQSYTSILILKVAIQIIALKLFSSQYLIWCLLEVFFATVASYFLNRRIKKEYPLLVTSIKLGKQIRKKYSNIIIKTKQLFFHKIGAFALTQTSPLILYAYSSLTMVTIYNNYMLIVMGITSLLNACFNSMSASVGNLVSEGNNKKIISVFEELFSIRFLLASICSYAIFSFSEPFVTLWIGEQFILDKTAVILLVIILFIRTTRNTVDDYIQAYGLYNDIYAPISETILNIGLSIIFGLYWGLNGILLGVLISLFLVICIWKPFFLFSKGLKISLKIYLKILLKNILCLLFSFLIIYFLSTKIIINNSNIVVKFVLSLLVFTSIFASVLFSLQYLVVKGIRIFTHRILSFIHTKE